MKQQTADCTVYSHSLYSVQSVFLVNVIAIFGFAILSCSYSRADEMEPISYPPLPDAKLFTALKTASPFLRTINIEDTYVLRAVATYEDLAYARVYNKETKQTITIELGGEPQQGLGLVQILGPKDGSDLTRVSARINFAGDVAELKYDPGQLTPTSRGGSGGGGGDRGKGSRGDKRGGHSEMRDKYSKLTDDQKSKFKAYIKATMQKKSNMSHEDRGALFRQAIEKLSSGKKLDIPK